MITCQTGYHLKKRVEKPNFDGRIIIGRDILHNTKNASTIEGKIVIENVSESAYTEETLCLCLCRINVTNDEMVAALRTVLGSR